MALKDWKTYKQTNTEIYYINEKTKSTILLKIGNTRHLYSKKSMQYNWFFSVAKFTDTFFDMLGNKDNTIFRQKSQALKFAKQYMRTH